LFDDFERFDNPSPILRSHPYSQTRREYVERYLAELGQPVQPAITPVVNHQKIKDLRDAQKLYPRDSISWKNLQKQIEELERNPTR
jgi:hypothetical protein